ncbi:MAG: DNA methyltransferase [Kofleriaceae bacterium]
MRLVLEHERAAIFVGDSKNLGDILPENSVDSAVMDPPAGIRFMGRTWDDDKGGRDAWIAWLAELMREVLRVLKPGGYVLVWAIPRTSHWTMTALEDAGFEIRDVHHDILSIDDALDGFVDSLDTVQRSALARILESQTSPILYQIFGTGMPKSLDMARQVDMHLCALPGRHFDKHLPAGAKTREGDHLCPEHPDREKYAGRTALKPAVEHWILARKPLDGTYAENVLAHGTGRLNVDGCRIGDGSDVASAGGTRRSGGIMGASSPLGGWHPTPGEGRWPAHLSLDEESARILDAQSGTLKSGTGAVKRSSGAGYAPNSYGSESRPAGTPMLSYGDSGGASRFFYVAKASRAEKDAGLDHLPARTGGAATGREDDSIGTKNPRAGAGRTGGARNTHPTVKNLDLMRWLVRLVTPPGGVVLDPFAGSGSTGVAAIEEGFQFVGVELGGENEEYVPILVGRVAHALGIPAPEGTFLEAGA